jgi:hypothetical protein
MASHWLARFSDSILRSPSVKSIAGFLALGRFFGSLSAVGAAATLVAGSIASASAAQIFGKGFGGRRVACVPLAGGTAKVIGRTREDTCAVRANANLAEIWARDASVYASQSSCVAPLEHAQPTL